MTMIGQREGTNWNQWQQPESEDLINKQIYNINNNNNTNGPKLLPLQ